MSGLARPPPSPPCAPAGAVNADFLAHAETLVAALESEQAVRELLRHDVRSIESLVDISLQRRQAGEASSAAAELQLAIARLSELLLRPGIEQHRSTISHAATAVATAQTFEAFLQTGTLGARPTLTAGWQPRAPRGSERESPVWACDSASSAPRSGRSSAASPYPYGGPGDGGLLLFLDDATNTGYAGVARVASAPNPAMPYLAEHQSRSSPGAAILGWFATAVEAAMAYSRHVHALSEHVDGAGGRSRLGSPAGFTPLAEQATTTAAEPARILDLRRGLPAHSPTSTLVTPLPAGGQPTPPPKASECMQPARPATALCGSAPDSPSSPSVEGEEGVELEYTDSEWLHAMLAAADQIGRYALGRATCVDAHSVLTARDAASALLEAMLAFDLPEGPLRRAYVALERAVRRLETISYEISSLPRASGEEDALASACAEADAEDAGARAGAAGGRVDGGLIVDADALQAARERFDAARTSRESVLKRWSELERLAKGSILSLHRGHEARAELQIAQATEGVRSLIAAAAVEHTELRELGAATVVEKLVEAKLFAAWLAEPGRVLHNSTELLGIVASTEEYLGALAHFSVDLGRYGLARATARDAHAVRACLGTALTLQSVALRIGALWPRGAEKKAEAIRGAPRNLESLLYELTLTEHTGRRIKTDAQPQRLAGDDNDDDDDTY